MIYRVSLLAQFLGFPLTKSWSSFHYIRASSSHIASLCVAVKILCAPIYNIEALYI